MIYQSHLEYDAAHPMGSGCTFLPEPKTKVACCEKAVKAAARPVTQDMGDEMPLNKGIAEHQAKVTAIRNAERFAKFEKLKGCGWLGAPKIGELLKISTGSVRGHVLKLVEQGHMEMNKVSRRQVDYRWIDK